MSENKKPTALNYVIPIIMIAFGGIHYIRHGLGVLTMLPVALGCFSLYLTFFNYPLLKRIENFIIKVWYPVGQFITAILLTVMFFIVFAPVGLLLRLLKKDILDKGFKVDRSSYWVERPLKQENDYTRQF